MFEPLRPRAHWELKAELTAELISELISSELFSELKFLSCAHRKLIFS